MQATPEFIIGSMIGLFTAFLWAISTNIYHTQSHEATPMAIAALKMWVAMCFMSVIVLLPFRTTPLFIPFDTIIILIASVTLGLVIGDTVYLMAQKRIGVSYAFPITSTYPIVTYIIAILILGDLILISRSVGIVIAVLGVILISREQARKNENGDSPNFDKVGLGLAFLAAICWALGSVLLQIGVADVDPIDANWIRMFFGGIIIAPVFGIAVKRGMPKPTSRASKIIIAAGLLGMTMGSLLYTYTVKLIGASVAALLGSTSPLFAVPISIFILKESYTWKSGIGVILTVAGVILVVLAV